MDNVFVSGNHIAVIATVAGGRGDIAFSANLVSLLLKRGLTIDLVVCQQAGGDGSESLTQLLGLLNTLRSAQLGVVCSTFRTASGCSPDFVLFSSSDDRTHGPPLLRAPRAIIQGPLKLFESPDAAWAALVRSQPTDSTIAPTLITPPTRHLVTIREFGQGLFCSPFSDDYSSGLGRGELGVFRIAKPVTEAVTDAVEAPYVVGYFRAGLHNAMLGRLVASTLMDKDRADPERLVFGPWSASASGDSAGMLQKFIAALSSHPSILRVTASDEGIPPLAADKRPRSAELASGMSGPVESHFRGSHDSSCWVEVAVLEVITQLGHSTRALTLRLVSLPSLALPIAGFRVLLSCAAAAVVTGDASLNEALCFGVPFWYSCEPHKIGVQEALKRIVCVQAGSAGGDVVTSQFPPPQARGSIDGGGGVCALATPATRCGSINAGTTALRRQSLHASVSELEHGRDATMKATDSDDSDVQRMSGEVLAEVASGKSSANVIAAWWAYIEGVRLRSAETHRLQVPVGVSGDVQAIVGTKPDSNHDPASQSLWLNYCAAMDAAALTAQAETVPATANADSVPTPVLSSTVAFSLKAAFQETFRFKSPPSSFDSDSDGSDSCAAPGLDSDRGSMIMRALDDSVPKLLRGLGISL
jgi:hypothetical protein